MISYHERFLLCALLCIILGCNTSTETIQSIQYEQNSFTTKGISIQTTQAPKTDTLDQLKAKPLGKPDTITLQTGYKQLKTIDLSQMGIPHIYQDDGDFVYRIDSLIGTIKKAGKAEKLIAKAAEISHVENKIFQGYTQRSGLKTWYLYDLKDDGKGSLWGIMASAGLFRFDGIHFYFLGEKQNLSPYSTTIDFDSEGHIWIGNGPLVTEYDGKYFKEYTLNETIPISANGVKSIFVDDQDLIWISTKIGLYRIDQKHNTKTLINTKSDISNGVAVLDKNGNIWITNKHGIHILKFTDNEKLQFDLIHYCNQQCLESIPFDSQHPMKIFISQEGDVFLYGKQGINKILKPNNDNYSSLQFLSIGKEQGLPSDNVVNVQEDGDGKIFASLEGHKMIEITMDDLDIRVKEFPPEQGMDGSHLSLKDKLGNVWLSNSKYILCKMTDNPFRVINYPINSLGFHRTTKDKWGRTWAATRQGGLYRFISYNSTQNELILLEYSKNSPLKSINVSAMFGDSKGSIWIGTSASQGLYRIDLSKSDFGNSIVHYHRDVGFSVSRIPDIFEDHKGNVWCSIVDYEHLEKGGMRRIQKNTYLSIDKTQLKPEPTVWAFKQAPDKSFWAYGAGSQTMINFDFYDNPNHLSFTHFDKEHHMTGYQYKNIEFTKDGSAWMGSRSSDGLVVVKPKDENGEYSIRHLTIKEGMPSTDIYSILVDFNDDVWVSTSEGLAKIEYETGDKNSEYSISSFTEVDGYQVDGTTENALFQMGDSLICVLIANQIMATFNPNKMAVKKKSPVVEIDDITVFDEEIPWKENMKFKLENGVILKDYSFDSIGYWTSLPLNLSLRYDNNFIGINFAGRALHSPHRLEYSYRLLGFEEEWSFPLTAKNALFGKLKPGHYTFQVRARHENSDWSDTASYAFQIRPPWWRTWYAYIIYTISFLAAILGIIRYRVKTELEKIRLLEKVRQKISADLHDDVGSILTGIAMQSEFLSIKPPKDLEKEMTDLSHMSREAMEKMRDIVWAMDSSKNKIVNLVDKMKYFAEERFLTSRFRYTFDITAEVGNISLNPEQKQNLYLIFKEALANILKHSNGTETTITLSIQIKNLVLSIHDNGNGFTRQSPTGFGLRSIAARTEALDGTFELDKSDGFTVKVKVPL